MELLQSNIHELLSATGFNPSDKLIEELCKRCSNAENALEYYIVNQDLMDNITCVKNNEEMIVKEFSNKIEKKCDICFDDFFVEDMYTLNCVSSHSFCFACISSHIKIAVLGGEINPPYIPACPLANGAKGCDHMMDEKEVGQVAGIVLNSPLLHQINYDEFLAIKRKIENLYLVCF
jgi:hypothetical protein